MCSLGRVVIAESDWRASDEAASPTGGALWSMTLFGRTVTVESEGFVDGIGRLESGARHAELKHKLVHRLLTRKPGCATLRHLEWIPLPKPSSRSLFCSSAAQPCFFSCR